MLLPHSDHTGFLPTFGPCFVNLYGTAAGTSHPLDVVTGSDELLEGNCYRGRLLISIQACKHCRNKHKTLSAQVFVNEDVLSTRGGPPVVVEPCQLITDVSTVPNFSLTLSSVSQKALGPAEHFLLFGCISDVSMLDKSFAGKSCQLEITMGVLRNENIPNISCRRCKRRRRHRNRRYNAGSIAQKWSLETHHNAQLRCDIAVRVVEAFESIKTDSETTRGVRWR